jgi:IPT/TIG domain
MGNFPRMKGLATMCCVLGAMFSPMFASAAHVLTTPVHREPQGRFEVAESAAAPTIAALSPTSGPIGTLVTIRGTNFTSNNLIQFRGAQASFAAGSPVPSENGTSLQFRVTTCPSHQLQCPGFYVPPGNYRVTVINANGTSNEATFALTAH